MDDDAELDETDLEARIGLSSAPHSNHFFLASVYSAVVVTFLSRGCLLSPSDTATVVRVRSKDYGVHQQQRAM